MNHLVEIYYIIDEIVRLEKRFKRGRKSKLTKSETLTILVIGHLKGLTTNKQIYELINLQYKNDFNLPCYAQFTKSIRSCEYLLDRILNVITQINLDKNQELFFIDSSSLPINGYEPYHYPKWATGLPFSKNMHGWYHGFKVHIIVDNNMKIVSIKVTTANIHDNKLLQNKNFTSSVKGKLIGDKGYHVIDEVKKLLRTQKIELIAKQKINMDPYLNEYYAPFLKKRRSMENIFARLKTRFSVIFRFVRTIEAFLVHAKAAIVSLILKDALK